MRSPVRFWLGAPKRGKCMKESFNELYTRLYNENFENLEQKRKREHGIIITLLIIVAFIFAARGDTFIS